MATKLVIDGNILRILPHIEQDWEKASKAEGDIKSLSRNRLLEAAGSYQRNAKQCPEDPQQQAHELLKAATLYHRADQGQLAIQCLYRYAQAMADHLRLIGDRALRMTYLAEVIMLMNDYIPMVPEESVGDIVKELEKNLAKYLYEASALDSLEELCDRHIEIRDILMIGQSFFDPNLTASLNQVQEALNTTSQFAGARSGGERVKLGNQAMVRLAEIRRDINSQPRREQATILKQLIAGWEKIMRAEVLQALEIVTTSAQPNVQKTAQNSVQDLIRKTEKQLRTLIEQKYRQQFGESWIQHVEAKHSKIYASWLRNLQRDKAAFQLYTNYSTAILDYSRLEDLAELVNAQWALFRDIFDFGYDKRNKSVFTEKIRGITKVRNPLAHHRPVPENELLRAQVYCNDILLAIERAKQTEND